MRIIAFLLATTVAGCGYPDVDWPNRPGATPTPVAAASCPMIAAALVGQPLSDALTARAQALTGRTTLRVIGPGDMVTKDYREDRLNVGVDAKRRVTAIGCY